MATRNKPSDVVGGGGGGGGTVGIDVYEDGVLVKAGATHIDVRGDDARVDVDGDGVKIWHPPPIYVSHFNTTDASNDATLSDISTTSRNVSTPSGGEGTPFYTGGWAGSAHPTTRSSPLSWVCANECSFIDQATTFTVNVTDPTGTPESYTTPVITGNGVHISGNITVTISNWAADTDKYKADVAVQVGIDGALSSNSGRFGVFIQHANGADGNFTYTQSDAFYDTELLAAALSGVTIAETGGSVVTRQISGVYYYTTGSDFTVDIADIDNLNSDSYPTTQVTVSGTEYGLPQLNLAGGSITGWTNDHDAADDTYQKTDWEISASQLCSVSASGNISARTEDWTSGSWVNSSNAAIAVNTYTDNSTRIYEDFRLETRRLTSDSTAWDETADLGVYDSGDGMQFQCSRLVYPQTDFGSYAPSAGSQPDYSAEAGDKKFYWSIYHTSTAHSNGRFQFGDYTWTETDITNDDILLEISLNGTDWYNCNENYTGGALSNGDGCRVDSGTYSLTINNQWAFTLGTGGFTAAGTGPDGWGLYVRITITDTDKAKYLGTLQEVTWT